MIRLLLLLVVFLASPASAWARSVISAEEALARGEAAIGRALPDLELVDSDGRPFRLAEFAGRPLLVSFVYTGCSTVCPALVQNLYPAVKEAQRLFGAEGFATLTIGFDARNDRPERLRSFARAQGVDLPNWRFATADQPTIDALAETLGFAYWPSAGGFDHLALVSVIDREGRIYRQIYGGVFATPQIVEPLKDIVFGRERSLLSLPALVDRIRWFCTVYDPRADRYAFSYAFFFGLLAGGATLAGAGLWMLREWLRRAGSVRAP
ncbi:MAG: SCO family protein [Geminicoccaceae bacterium]|nr:SCO family protein [Geminicoccaceae bacterium]